MGLPTVPKPVKLVMSLIVISESFLQDTLKDLEGAYGDTDFVSPRMVFDFTDYYTPEMGSGLKRTFVAFRRLIDPGALASVKQRTNQLEQRYAQGGGRKVNIDPGYLSAEHLVLATTKAYSHRPYLRDGIYADLTLIYRKGSYGPLEWTYPDYRQHQVVQMFNAIRKSYLSQLREVAEAAPLT